MQNKLNTLVYIFVLLLSNFSAHAVDQFTIEDIRVEGLQRITPGTVFNYLPMKVGDTFDDTRSAEAVRPVFLMMCAWSGMAVCWYSLSRNARPLAASP